MIKQLFLVLFVAIIETKWTWIGGSSGTVGEGVFGQKNISSSSSFPSGTSDESLFAYDDGMYYTFGGVVYNGNSDNIWYFNPQTGLWTWINGDSTAYPAPMYAVRQGVPSPFNTPGGRQFTAFFRDENYFYVFGGYISQAVITNAMFRWNVATGLWELLSGRVQTGFEGNFGVKGVEASTNEPPALYGFAYGYDKNDRTLYVFGGANILYQTSVIRKVSATWKYNLTSQNWTWIAGPSDIDQKAVYGNKTVGTTGTLPGSRFLCASSYDPLRKLLWMFGGNGFSVYGEGALNDLWKYSVDTNIWTWMAGERITDYAGNIGNKNVYSDKNSPKARYSAALFADYDKNLIYMFGGASSKSSSISLYSDLWKFDPELNMWVFFLGSPSPNQPGQYGTINVASDSNTPPGKASAGYFYDSKRKQLVLHSGLRSPSGIGNDLWVYVDDAPPPSMYGSYEESGSLTATETLHNTTSHPFTRRYLPGSDNAVTTKATALPTYAIIGIAGGGMLIIVVGVLLLMKYIKRQSYKEAIMAEAQTSTVNSTTVDDTTALDTGSGPSTKSVKKGSSSINLSAVVTPSPLMEYSLNYVQTLKTSAPIELEANGFEFDAVIQIGTQNGSALYNGLAKGGKLKEKSDKVMIKVFGDSTFKLQKGVEGAFWEEVCFLNSLGNAENVTNMLAYCVEPVAIVFPPYELGTLEQIITQKSLKLTESDVFHICHDLSRAIKTLHTMNYAHRTIKLRNIFIGKKEKGSYYAVLAGFGGMQKCNSDESAAKIFAIYRIDAKSAQFVAPEMFLGLRGQIPKLNTAQALKAGDLFSWSITISLLLGNPDFQIGRVYLEVYRGRFPYSIGCLTNDLLNNFTSAFAVHLSWLDMAKWKFFIWGFHYRINVTSDQNIPDGSSEVQAFSNDGKLFIFGGYNGNADSNNIMIWDPVTGYYAWLAGDGNSYPAPISATRRFTYNPFNAPGGRSSCAFVLDKIGNAIFIFGGRVATLQYTNTVFRFDLGTLQYALWSGQVVTGAAGVFGVKGVSGLTYEPPALYAPAYWTDHAARKMYIFGGSNILSQTSVERLYADTWVFDFVSGNWTWLHGNGQIDQKGFFGNISTYGPDHVPGSRKYSSAVFDETRKIAYVFGGNGYAKLELGNLNDLWSYSIELNMWSWIGGTYFANPAGSYGELNVYSPKANPKGRYGCHMGLDPSTQTIYLFGGASTKSTSVSLYNDLWKFNLQISQWAWVQGPASPNGAGAYGTKGVAGASNLPPAKAFAGYWFDPASKIFYLDGGSKSPSGLMNDLWTFKDDLPPPSDYYQYDSQTVTTSTTQASTERVFTRKDTRLALDQPVNAKPSLPTYAIIGIAGGVMLIIVIFVLILMRYIKRQSMKEALMVNMTTEASTTIDDSSVLDAGPSTKSIKKGSSSINLSAVVTPSPLIEYSLAYTEKLKSSAPKPLEVDGFGFDAVLQIGTQNGSALYNGLAKSNTLKEKTDKVMIKVFGDSTFKLQKGVEGAFWEEISLLNTLGTHEYITSLLGYCIEPVAIIYTSYALGNLDQIITNKTHKFTESEVFSIVFDLAKAIKLLHSQNYAHRNIKLRNIFIGKTEKGKLYSALSGFGGLQKLNSDDTAAKLFPLCRIDAKSAQFVAPEVFLALKGQVVKLNSVQALKAGDLFSWAATVSKMLKSIGQ